MISSIMCSYEDILCLTCPSFLRIDLDRGFRVLKYKICFNQDSFDKTFTPQVCLTYVMKQYILVCIPYFITYKAYF